MASPEISIDSGWKRRTTLFLTGQTVSLFGSSLVQYAVMWYLTLETKAGTAIMLYAVFGFVPQGLLSLFGGVWADRLNRKYLIIAADATIAAVTLILALAMSAGVTDLWLILAIVAVRSAGAGIQTPAVSALLPQLVPSEKLLRVNGIFSTINSVMFLVAPAVAGIIYASWSLIPTFYIDIVTATIGILILLTIPVARIQPSGEKVSYLADLVGGLRYSWSHRFVRWMLVVYGTVFLLTAGPSFLTPLMVARDFGDEVWKLTVLEIVFAVGMTAAGALVAGVFAEFNKAKLILAGCLTFAIGSIAVGMSPNLWIFYVFMFVTGAAVPLLLAPSTTYLQQTVEPEYQGRVFSLVSIIMAVAMPLGMVVMGPLADVVDIGVILVVTGLLTVFIVVVAFVLPIGRRALADKIPYVGEGPAATD